MSVLLPCPFCGETRISINAPNDFWPRGSINCPGCLATVPGEISGTEREPELVDQWNTRVFPDTQVTIGELLTTLRHARTFVTSREKMHKDGVELYDELIEHLASYEQASQGSDK